MSPIREAGEGKTYLMCTRNHRPRPAMGRDMQTGSAMQTASGKQTVSAKYIACAKQPGSARQAAAGKQLGGSAKRSGSAARGFTLLELMIVITIISLLVGIAAGAYVKSVQRAKEATLKSDLTLMRQAIDHYTLDKEAAPPSLEEFTNPQSQYLRETPKYPITDAKHWHVEFGDTEISPHPATPIRTTVPTNSTSSLPFT